MILTFTIPGEPAHAARARAVAFAGHARMYAPKENVISGKIIRDYATEAMNGADLIQGPIQLIVSAHYLFPASWSKPKCARTNGWKTSRPDLDNIVKLYKDAFTGIVWRDDCQVVREVVEKRYADKAFTRVTIEELAVEQRERATQEAALAKGAML